MALLNELKNGVIELPDHLKELIQPTPSGVDKLLAAWDGLSVETQLLILSIIKTDDYLSNAADSSAKEKIRIKALDSSNDFVRYTAAKEMFFPHDCTDEDKAIEQRITNDPSDLVKFSQSIFSISDDRLENATVFFSLPHKERLALVRNLEDYGESVAALITHAINDEELKDTISEIEICEILQDYLSNSKFKEYYISEDFFSGFDEYRKGKDISALWKLATMLPANHKARAVLILNLPAGSGLNRDAVIEYIEKLNDRELSSLLARKNIGLQDYRDNLFWKGISKDKYAWYSAVAYNFRLRDSELSKIFSQPYQERFISLKGLFDYAQELNLHQYLAIEYELRVLYRDGWREYPEYSPEADDFNWEMNCTRDKVKKRFDRFVKETEEGPTETGYTDKERGVDAFRLMNLAISSIEWIDKYDAKQAAKDADFEYLYDNVVPGSAWETYISWKLDWNKSLGDLPKVDWYESNVKNNPIDKQFDSLKNEIKETILSVIEFDQSTIASDNLKSLLKKNSYDLSKIKCGIVDVELKIEHLKNDQSMDINEIKLSIVNTQWIVFAVGALIVVFFIALAG